MLYLNVENAQNQARKYFEKTNTNPHANLYNFKGFKGTEILAALEFTNTVLYSIVLLNDTWSQ